MATSSPIPGSDAPVAYDTQGNSLYARPRSNSEQDSASVPPQVVYVTRPAEPAALVITEDVKQRHDASVKRYPSLNLSAGEFIVVAVRRHPIGIISLWAVMVMAIIALFAGTILLGYQDVTTQLGITPGAVASLQFILLFGTVLLFGVGVIATIVFNGNRIILTNESVIQSIQTSLFSKREQTVSLENVEDASYTQRGILQFILDYGSVRLSTQGSETTYRMTYVMNPRKQVAILNDAVEAFKNGRPVDAECEPESTKNS